MAGICFSIHPLRPSLGSVSAGGLLVHSAKSWTSELKAVKIRVNVSPLLSSSQAEPQAVIYRAIKSGQAEPEGQLLQSQCNMAICSVDPSTNFSAS